MSTLDLRPGGVNLLGTVGSQFAITITLTPVDAEAAPIAPGDVTGVAFAVYGPSSTAAISGQGPTVTSSDVGADKVISVVFTAEQTTALRAANVHRWQLVANFDGGGVVPVVGGELSFKDPGVPGASTSSTLTVEASIGTGSVAVDVTVGGAGGSGSGISGIRVEDEGSSVVATATAVNFVGSTVTVTDAGSGEATVTIAAQPLDSDLTAIAAANNGSVLAATTASFTTADETKLDGIEAGAEVNDSAAEILAKLVTVDGAGSGLDADLLDGVSSAGFATAGHNHDGTYQPLDADLTALAAAGNSGVLAATTASFLTADETKLDGIEAGADVTDAANVNAAGAVMESDFDAHTILAATTDNTPTARTIDQDRVVGRLTGGNITGLTGAEVAGLVTPTLNSQYVPLPASGAAAGKVLAVASTGPLVTEWADDATGGGGGGAIVVVKGSDESITSDDTISNDAELSFAVGANEEWAVQIVLQVTAASATPDIDVAIAVPAGATALLNAYGSRSTDALLTNYLAVAAATELTVQIPNSGTPYMILLMASVTTGGTSGTVNLQWAQNTSSINALAVKAGSFLVANKVA